MIPTAQRMVRLCCALIPKSTADHNWSVPRSLKLPITPSMTRCQKNIKQSHSSTGYFFWNEMETN
eukprot:409283-Ditylum_brightwellii.AAC.1